MEIGDLLAKVLATENLSVERKNTAETAYFDLEKRVLVLPVWKSMTTALETMLIEHEVGHALFTPKRYSDVVRKTPEIAHILNVVEDPREERLFKERYPGARKDFVLGAKELLESDFLGINSMDVNSLNFIDRMNVYFKLGSRSGVKFRREEVEFVNRASTIVTFDEAEKLSYDILAFLKEQAKGYDLTDVITVAIQNLDGDIEQGDDDFDGDPILMDIDGDDGDGEYTPQTEDDVKNQAYQDVLNKLITSSTIIHQEQKIKEHQSDDSFKYEVIPDEYYYEQGMILSYKDIIEGCRQWNDPKADAWRLESHREFKAANATQVQHLISLFELKKAASVYAKRSIRKTGALDVKKLASYKVKDDIFLRNMVVPEGKNHGMVLLLDWSASMLQGDMISRSLDQVAQLVMFCRATNIPHRVFAFATREAERIPEQFKKSNDKNGEFFVELLELFSDKMSLTDYNEMMTYVCSRRLMYTFRLHATPLMPALCYMRTYLPKFRQQYKIDKLNLITFTDGENTNNLIGAGFHSAVYITDQVTKKNYIATAYSGGKDTYLSKNIAQCNAMYQILKDRCGVTITSYYAASGTPVWTALKKSGYAAYVSQDIILRYRKDGFVAVKGFGRDYMYVVANRVLDKSGEMKFEVDSNMTAAAIAKTIKTTFKKTVRNKLLLEKFADSIS